MIDILKTLAAKYPGIIFPHQAPVTPGGLIGFLHEEMKQRPDLVAIADAHLPKKPEH